MKHLVTIILLSSIAGRAYAVELYPDDEAPRFPIVVYAPRYVPPVHPLRRVIVRDDGRRRVEIVDPSEPRFTLAASAGVWLSILEQERIAPIGRVRLGVDVEGAELTLGAAFAPDAAFYTVDAAFAYRFFPDEIVHPFIGAGLGAVITEDTSAGFAASVRAGVEIAAELDEGELAVGADAIGTQVAFADDRFPWVLGSSVSVSLYVDYRL